MKEALEIFKQSTYEKELLGDHILTSMLKLRVLKMGVLSEVVYHNGKSIVIYKI